jgi:hypothetical protein
MKLEIPFRIIVDQPLTGVSMQVQRGKNELLPACSMSDSKLTFEFTMSVETDGGSPNFLGKYAQGPKASRFVYVNSGTYGGQTGTSWGRRAKLSLMDITTEQIEDVIADPGSRLETRIPGIGRDGGPICASVKGIEWKVVRQ